MSLQVNDLVAGYTRFLDILHGVNIKTQKSKITCILGPNGCGKTTLLKTIYGFLKPKSGSVLYDGEDITGTKPYHLLEKGIAYVLQRRSVFPQLTVQENLEVGVWSIRRDREKTKAGIDYVYERFPNLAKRKKVNAGLLSGGEQRMLEIGRALILHPKTLLLDEPSAGLAPKVVKEVYAKIAELKDEEMTILLVDQNVRLAVSLADYIYIMELGRNKTEGNREYFEKDMKEMIKDWLRFSD